MPAIQVMSVPGMYPKSLFVQLFVVLFLVVVVAFALEAMLTIRAGQGTIETLVTEGLTGRVDTVLEEVRRYLSDRSAEIRSWSKLSTMDELLAHDQFLLLESLLLDLQREHKDQYVALTVLDRSELVIASTDVGQVGHRVNLSSLGLRHLPASDLQLGDYPTPPGGAPSSISLVHPVFSGLGSEPTGWLWARVRWDPVENILSNAGARLPGRGKGSHVFLVDSRGRLHAGQAGDLERLVARGILPADLLGRGRGSGGLNRVRGYLVAESHFPRFAEAGDDLRIIALWEEGEAFSVVRIFMATVAGAAAVAVLLVAAVSWVIAGRITCRLHRLMEGTKRLARGELTFQVEEGREDELGYLARSFNAMAEELARTRDGLEEAVARWSALVTHAPDYIFTVDREGRVLFINRVVSGLTREEVVGSFVYRYILPDHVDQMRTAIEGVFGTGKGAEVNLLGRGPGGTMAWYNLRIGPIWKQEQVEAVTVIATDITERKGLEREILKVSEQERERFGRDLHDGLGQMLTGIALLSKGLEQKLEARSLPEASEARQIKDFSDSAIQQTRALAKGLFPVDLPHGGLREMLEELAAQVKQVFRVSCSVEGTLGKRPLANIEATHLFRIVQEAVNNSLRHGKADQIRIILRSDEDGKSLMIRDNGVGLPPGHLEAKGMGLRSMQYRAGVIGASLGIRGDPAGGTVVECRFSYHSA